MRRHTNGASCCDASGTPAMRHDAADGDATAAPSLRGARTRAALGTTRHVQLQRMPCCSGSSTFAAGCWARRCAGASWGLRPKASGARGCAAAARAAHPHPPAARPHPSQPTSQQMFRTRCMSAGDSAPTNWRCRACRCSTSSAAYRTCSSVRGRRSQYCVRHGALGLGRNLRWLVVEAGLEECREAVQVSGLAGRWPAAGGRTPRDPGQRSGQRSKVRSKVKRSKVRSKVRPHTSGSRSKVSRILDLSTAVSRQRLRLRGWGPAAAVPRETHPTERGGGAPAHTQRAVSGKRRFPAKSACPEGRERSARCPPDCSPHLRTGEQPAQPLLQRLLGRSALRAA
jgi:hypothetical protein